MDEVVSRCRQQLTSFRIRELKDVLSRLGLPKQGKKQILMDKIMGVLVPAEKLAVVQKGVGRGNKHAVSRDECVTVIDDIYRKLRGEGAPDLASAGKKDAGAGSSSVARSEEPDEASNWGEAKTRCPCGNSKDQGVMIQCDDSKCGVWQHISCVVIPEKPVEGAEPEVPSQFYCELCRINRSDPFCVTLQSPLVSTKLSSNGTVAEGTNPLQNVEKTFQLSAADGDLLRKPAHDLQVWCVLLNDKVPFRMHWPAYADLRVNGVSVRVTNRPGQQLLGANGRDEGPGIASFTREGLNRISFSAYDARPFVLGLRIMRRNTLQQIFAMIPDVSTGEQFDEALARVRRCINGGGQGTADDDDDSDLEVVADSITVNLRCPMSGSRIKTAGRFKPCLHMGCFDLHTFVELNQRARKWQCPICLKNYSLENLIIDPFVNCVTTALKNHAEDVTEVEMKADGHWRPKVEGEKSHEPWRSPDGSIVIANGSVKESRTLVPLAAVKIEEGLSSQERGSLRIGMKRSHDGQWAINGSAKRLNGWAANNVAGPSQKAAKPVVPIVQPVLISRSSSATDSNEDNGEDGERSVNQEPSKEDAEVAHYFDDNEVSYPPKAPSKGLTWPSTRPTESQQAADVIVLSDTDDEEGDNLGARASGTAGGSDAMAAAPVSTRPPRPLSLSMDTEEASESPVLVNMPHTFSHVNSTTTANNGPTSTIENRGSAGGGVIGLPLEPNNFWNAPQIRPPVVPFNYFPSSSELPSSSSAQHNPPIRPTALPAAATSVFSLSTRQHRESMPRSWRFGRSPTPSYSNSDCNGVGSDGNGASSPRESPLQLFLPHQPARAQVQPSLRDPVDDVDNNWFSLSLGGSDRNIDPVPKRSNHRASQVKGCGLDSLATTASEVLLGMNTNGNHTTPAADSRSRGQNSPPYLSPVDSLSPARTSPVTRINPLSPIRPSPARGNRHRSPMQLHKHRHNYFRVVESDSD